MQSQPNEQWVLAKDARARRIDLRQQRREHKDADVEGSSSRVKMSQSGLTTKRSPLGNLTNALASPPVRSSIASTSRTPKCSDATSAQLQKHKRQRISDLSSISRAINFNEVMHSQPSEKWALAKNARARRKDIRRQRREHSVAYEEGSSSHITMSQSIQRTKINSLVLASQTIRSEGRSTSRTPENSDATTSMQLQTHKRQRISDISSVSRAMTFREDVGTEYASDQTNVVWPSIHNSETPESERKVMQSQTNEKWVLAKDARARRIDIRQQIREHNEITITDGEGSSSRLTWSQSRSTRKTNPLLDMTNVFASHSVRSSNTNNRRTIEYNYPTTSAQLEAHEAQRIINLPSLTDPINYNEDIGARYSPNHTNAVDSSIDNPLFGKAEIKETLDFDDPSFKCAFCKALLWYEERAEKCRDSNQPEFSICCMKGKVQLPLLKKPPDLLFNLFNGIDARSSHFMKNIRKYNCMFSFTSIEGKIETSQNNGRSAPQFTLRGKNDHNIGSLLPQEGGVPKYTQLYIYDTQNEISNRMSHFSKGKNDTTTDRSLVEDLKNMIDQHNVLAQSFRRTRDFMEREPTTNVSLRLLRTRCRDSRTYNIPTMDEVAALIVGDFNSSDVGRDIVVRKQCGFLQRIHETHPAFIPLQYPLLFPWGEDGYEEEIPIRESFLQKKNAKRQKVSIREFIAFRIHERDNDDGIVLRAQRLFLQFLVDAFTMIEAQRIQWAITNQDQLRGEIMSGLQEAVTRGETDPATSGQRIVLPTSFTGGMRYMFNNCQDAMAICRRYGYPDLFITITCNPQWPEIARFMSKSKCKAGDRPDIESRVFKMKLDHLEKDLKNGKIFGDVIAGLYTVEFQKRGLPHAHILIWLHSNDKLRTTESIDRVICAELPDKNKYPRLYESVTRLMMHGPCGADDPKSPCMDEGKCKKYFPKKFVDKTTFDESGYPIYKRRNTGITTMKKNIELDNRFVVPYNPELLMRYQAHINIEYCNKSNSIKYLFKYVNKGPDRVTVAVGQSKGDSDNGVVYNEPEKYYNCRYLSACEASWRILAFDIHHRWPSVLRLTFHLPGQKFVTFKDKDEVKDVYEKNVERLSMFEAWLFANTQYSEGRNLTYAEFPGHFRYNKKERQWLLRKQRPSIGRLHYVPARVGELYYLRLLLTVQRGCTSYQSLRTVNNCVHSSFEAACEALGLLADDREFIEGIKEAAELGSGNQLRKLFVTLLVTNAMSRPSNVWEKAWELLADGILFDRRKILRNPELTILPNDLQNLCLIEIEKLLNSNGRSLKEFKGMPFPFDDPLNRFQNNFLVEELNYDKTKLSMDLKQYLSTMNDDQRKIYDEIMDVVTTGRGGFYFVYGYGGTGKTFLWKSLSAALRSNGKIVLNVASSGIAALLLLGGRTAHSRFSIPLALSECSTCTIKQGSPKAELIQQASLIIWDEACMMNKFAFEALDRTFRDIMRFSNKNSENEPFGGKTVVLGGDFRQILPVLPRASREEIVEATINSSKLWSYCKVFTLTRNMRLHLSGSNHADSDTQNFSEWIIKIGDGQLGVVNDGIGDIEIPHESLILNSSHPLKSIVEFTYPNLLENMKDYTFFVDRALLAPTLEVVEMINEFVLSLIPGEEKEYLSSDSSCQADSDIGIDGDWITAEFLNDIKCSGIPNHRIVLKKGVPIMLLRNIDQTSRLCNGTRLIVEELRRNVIGAIVVSGNNAGEKVYIPRMNLVPSDPGLPLKFQRRQFPISLCFAMTINKSQGQTLSFVGLFLTKSVFTHGQLYVAVSRVKAKTGLKVLVLDDSGMPCNFTKNVVYPEVFQKIWV